MNTLFPRRRLERTLVALLCAQLLGGCAYAEKIAPDSVRWPTPAPDALATQRPTTVAMQVAPNFEAPSATSCMRPVQTVEFPGAAARQSMADGAGASPPIMRRREHAALEKDAAFAGRADEARDRAEAAPGAGTYPAAPAPVAKAASPAAAPMAEATGKSMPFDSRTESSVEPAQPLRNARQEQPEQVTAGMVDDNADFSSYLQFLRKYAKVSHRERDVRERYPLQVRTPSGRAVPDAEVALRAANGAAMWARTDSAGRAWVHPRAFDPQGSASYQVAVRKDGQLAQGVLTRGQKSAVEVVIDAAAPAPRARLDLVFLVDATGSMGDEIGKLRASLRSIADEVARLPSQPDLCFGLVAYRDRGDAFLMRRHNLSNDLTGFQSALNALQADGGGDYPEAMNEAFHDTVHNIDWRGSGATRLVVLLADAPPHLDYGGPQYDQDMQAALGKGIKVFSVGASGLDRQGEDVQRQIAQYTGGSFVFLTYQDAHNPGSGPGRETVHDVRNYSVQTLDKLIVRLVSEELGKLPGGNG